jgi:hypothetical protein
LGFNSIKYDLTIHRTDKTTVPKKAAKPDKVAAQSMRVINSSFLFVVLTKQFVVRVMPRVLTYLYITLVTPVTLKTILLVRLDLSTKV